MPRRRGPTGRVRNRRNVDIGGTPAPYPQTLLVGISGVSDNGSDTYITLQASEWVGSYWQNSSLLNWRTNIEDSFKIDTLQSPISIDDTYPPTGQITLRFAGVLVTGQSLGLPPWCNQVRGPNGEWLAGMKEALP